MNTPLVDWDADDWGGNVHVASWAPDGHDDTEAVES